MRRIAIAVALLMATVAGASGRAAADLGTGANSCVDLRGIGFVHVLCQVDGNTIPFTSRFHRTVGCEHHDAKGNVQTDGTWWWTPHPVGLPPSITIAVGADPTAAVQAWVANLVANGHPPVLLFDLYCEHEYLVASSIQVAITDPALDPTPEIDRIAAQLLLPIPAPQFTSLPDLKNWGGLVVNNPALFGVTPASWQPHTTTGTWLGFPFQIVAIPQLLEFHVNNTPVPCVRGFVGADPNGPRFPAEPAGFRDTPLDPPDKPLSPRQCVWTPREPGSVNVTATVTYSITATIAGGAIPRPDFIRTITNNIDIVELRNVITEARTS